MPRLILAAIVAGLVVLLLTTMVGPSLVSPSRPASSSMASSGDSIGQGTTEPARERLVSSSSRFRVVGPGGVAVASAVVGRVPSTARGIKPDAVLGRTDETGTLEIPHHVDHDDGVFFAYTPDTGSELFARTGEREWTCVLKTRHRIRISFRMKNGELLRRTCRVVASLRPWSHELNSAWARESPIPNPADPTTSVVVAQTDEGSLELEGLREGDYCVEVMCDGHVATAGVSEMATVRVPGGPYECVMEPILAAVTGVSAPDEILGRSYKMPQGVTRFFGPALRAMRRSEQALRDQYPAKQWVVVVGMDERSDASLAPRLRVKGLSSLRGYWEQDLELRPVDELVPCLVAKETAGDCSVEVRLSLEDSRGRKIDNAEIDLVGGQDEYGLEFRHRLVVDRPTRIPKGRYRFDSFSRPLTDALKGTEADVALDGVLQVVAPRPLVACRVRVDSDVDLAGVWVSLSSEGERLRSYNTEGAHPIVWVPEGRIMVSATSPGFDSATSAFDVSLLQEPPLVLTLRMRSTGR